MVSLKPLVLYGEHLGPPNPLKVMIILKELGLPFETKDVPFSEVKNPEYIAMNPNGRIPILYDPNTDFTIWESGAIIQYIVAEYDTSHKLSFPVGTKESHLLNQWLHFQMSGQGPYYGQAFWFSNYHPEKIPSAVERYKKELRRVTGALNIALEGKQYLVGDKLTYADLAFVPWQNAIAKIDPEFDAQKEAPNTVAWMERMKARPAVAELLVKLQEQLKQMQM